MNWVPLSCFLFEFFLETSPQMFHTATIWLTLALAILRYVYICRPHLAKQYCTLPLAAKIVRVILSLAVLQAVSRTVDREYLVFSIGGLSNCMIQLFKSTTIYLLAYSPSSEGHGDSVCFVRVLEWVNYITVDTYFMVFFW